MNSSWVQEDRVREGLAIDAISLIATFDLITEEDVLARKLASDGRWELLQDFSKACKRNPTPTNWQIEEALEVMHDRPITLTAAQVLVVYIEVMKHLKRIAQAQVNNDDSEFVYDDRS